MFGIPEWAIGIGFIIMIGSVMRMIGGRKGDWRRGLRQRPMTFGLHLPDASPTSSSGEFAAAQRETLEDVQRRLAEVEERLDFAERMLAQRREADKIAPPSP